MTYIGKFHDRHQPERDPKIENDQQNEQHVKCEQTPRPPAAARQPPGTRRAPAATVRSDARAGSGARHAAAQA